MARTVEQHLVGQIAQLVLLNARQSVQIEALTEELQKLKQPPAPDPVDDSK